MGVKLYLVMRQALGADQMEGIYFDSDKAEEVADQIEWGYVQEYETDDDQ